MDIPTLGRLIAQQRRAKGLTLVQLANEARLGRSTLAALEGGKLSEIGWAKVARLATILELVMDLREPLLTAPLMPHRHLTDLAGRELTKAAIDDVVCRGDIRQWRGLVTAMHGDGTGRLAERVREVVTALAKQDPKAKAFRVLMKELKVF